jgi:integrase
MDLSALRTAARAALAIADAGRNPAAERDARAAAWIVRQLWQAYRASPEFTRHTPKVQDGIVAAFSLHIVPRFGNERLADIDIPMVRRLMRAIAADNRTNARRRKLGGPGAARKVVRLFSSALTWAVAEGQLSRNPIIGSLRLDGDGARETVITEPAQYAALFEAMDRMMADGELRPAVRAFLVSAALTGMRRGELQALRWGQVDLTQRRITLTTSKGAKLARRGLKTENISLPPLAAAALAEIRPEDAAHDERVFLPRQGEALEVNRSWRRVRAAAGLPGDLTLHGLRHSIGTTAVLSGLSAPEVQALLRHRNITTTARYIHLAEATQSRLQDRATAHLVADRRAGSEVTRLARRRV